MNPTDPAYFETLYRQDPDPWKFASSAYEHEKYAATLAALPPRRIRRGFEVGCSIGVLTRQLAAHCDALLAIDVSETALTQARHRCVDLENVTLDRMAIPTEWPQGSFDLVVFSEVLYYLGPIGIQQAAQKTCTTLAPGGTVLLVNWKGETGAPCTGNEAATLFIDAAANRLTILSQNNAETYRLDVLGERATTPPHWPVP